MQNKLLGTTEFMAPEIVAGKSYDGRLSDIFAAGVTLFMLVTRQYPFEIANQADERFQHIVNNDPESFWDNFKSISISSDLKDLLFGMMAADPNNRLTLN